MERVFETILYTILGVGSPPESAKSASPAAAVPRSQGLNGLPAPTSAAEEASQPAERRLPFLPWEEIKAPAFGVMAFMGLMYLPRVGKHFRAHQVQWFHPRNEKAIACSLELH